MAHLMHSSQILSHVNEQICSLQVTGTHTETDVPAIVEALTSAQSMAAISQCMELQ